MAEDCVNPLFARWLKEWMDHAHERNSKGYLVYKKAYQSMRSSTNIFQHASEAEQLSGIGPKLCARLAEEHNKYCHENGLAIPQKPRKAKKGISNSEEQTDDMANEPPNEPPAKKRKVKEYVPQLRSGAYALVMALSELDQESMKAIPKRELIEKAQPFSDSSFTVPSDPTKFYTAWKSMETLEKKELICTKGHPTKRYYLSDEGWEVALRMRRQEGKETSSLSSGHPTTKVPNKTLQPRRHDGDAQVIDIESNSESDIHDRPRPHLIPIKDSGLSAKRVSQAQMTSIRPIILKPGTFEVQLLLDTREVRTKLDRDYIGNELRKHDIVADIRALPLGDVLWVAKLKAPHDAAFKYENDGDEDDGSSEIILEHIVERKRLDDLISSIKDGRFHEQKFRLKKSGIRHISYLVESYAISAERQDLYGQSVESAIAQMQVVDDIFVKQTSKMDDTIKYLARITKSLKMMYEDRELYVLPSQSLDVATHHITIDELRTENPTNVYGITFSAFCSLCDKSDSLTLRDVFLKMLMCQSGVTGDKAIEIQKIWPTPNAFIEAYNSLGADKKAKETMVSHHLSKQIARKQVGKALSAKIAEVWAT